MSGTDAKLAIELRPSYVDATGTQRHAAVEVVGDAIDFLGDQIVVTHYGSSVFTSSRDDVTRIRVVGSTDSPPPRFIGRINQPWSDDEDAALRELSASRASIGRLNYEMGRPAQEISKRIGQLGLPHPPR